MKICPKCRVRPSIRNERKNYAPYCVECSAAYTKARNDERQKIIKAAKARPCMDCGMSYPYYVMDLDHRDNKFKAVSAMHSYSISRLLVEIEKCDVVCANCHRERTYSRQFGPVAQSG